MFFGVEMPKEVNPSTVTNAILGIFAGILKFDTKMLTTVTVSVLWAI
jgi:hypothetical protein